MQTYGGFVLTIETLVETGSGKFVETMLSLLVFWLGDVGIIGLTVRLDL